MSGRDDAIIGGRELDQLLATLVPKVEKNIMRTALRAGAVVFLEEVKARVPRNNGDLAASARITSRVRRGEVSASAKVGNKTAWYAHLVEYGTRAHKITAKREGGALRFLGVTSKSVMHPGAKAGPFMRPAADAAFTGAVAAVQKKIRERLTKAGLNAAPPLPTDPEE